MPEADHGKFVHTEIPEADWEWESGVAVLSIPLFLNLRLHLS
jgi:hypothetical protein